MLRIDILRNQITELRFTIRLSLCIFQSLPLIELDAVNIHVRS